MNPFTNTNNEIEDGININIQTESLVSRDLSNKKFPLFFIAYDIDKKHYYLQSLTKEIFLSYLLVPFQQFTLYLNVKYLFKIGKVNFSLIIKESTKLIEIKVKKNSANKEEKKYMFIPSQCPITIGRVNSTINIKCDSLSKSHIMFDYDKHFDRFFIIDNDSTNGSQLLLKDGKWIILTGEMRFNLGTKQFIIEEITR